jgi:hypothetical protein
LKEELGEDSEASLDEEITYRVITSIGNNLMPNVCMLLDENVVGVYSADDGNSVFQLDVSNRYVDPVHDFSSKDKKKNQKTLFQMHNL